MNKATIKSVETARLHLAIGNMGGYSRVMASLYRSSSSNKVQVEIVTEIDKDNMNHLFYFKGDCLMAKEAA